ncbi:histone-lysine N-methyltransferase SETMAR, partial [Trichonephila clavipes]
GNASQVAEIVNGVYGTDNVTANYVQFWFRRFSSGIFDVKDALRTGRPVVENVDKIPDIIEVGRQVSSPIIAKELQIDHKTVLHHLRKVGFKKKNDKNPEGFELANMVTDDAKRVVKVAKLSANSIAKSDANLALPPKFR